jgi:purine-binding chemotaxis protein CheW
MDTATELTQAGLWATFYLAGEIFGIRVEDVQEVLMPQPLTPVPLAPDHIVGLLNLRGHIMPAIDLRRRLHFPERSAAEGSILVLKIRGCLVSVVVDEIGDVLSLPPHDWRPPPDTLAARHLGAVFGICPIENQVVLGLRVEALGGTEEVSA